MSWSDRNLLNLLLSKAWSNWVDEGAQKGDIQWESKNSISASISVSGTAVPAEYRVEASIMWKMQRFPRWKWSMRITSLKDRLTELNDTFRTFLGLQVLEQSLHELTTRFRYCSISLIHMPLRFNKSWMSLRLAWPQTYLWTLSMILSSDHGRTFIDSLIIPVAQSSFASNLEQLQFSRSRNMHDGAYECVSKFWGGIVVWFDNFR